MPLIRRLLLALPVALALWLGILALVMRIGGAAPAAFVPFPPAGLMAALGDGVTFNGASAISLTVRSDAPDLVRRLYRAGAWIVLPAGLDACIPAFLRRDDP